MSDTIALLFDPGGEGVVGRARTAAVRILARNLFAIKEIDRVVVSTPIPKPFDRLPVEVEVDPPGRWEFGKRLAELVRKLRPARLIYFSAGSGFLLPEAQLAQLAELEPCPPPFAILNNFYSTDFGVIVPPVADLFADLARDNPLGIRLWQAGYQCFELPRSSATQLDIDTPGELQILALMPNLPDEMSVLGSLPTERARRIVDLIPDPGAELLIIGRVGGHVVNLLEREAACRIRLLSEERGMEASGRQTRVRCLLAGLAPGIDAEVMVNQLSELADGVVWDTRVLMAHFGIWPPPEERFACDLMNYEEVQTPLLRNLARACLNAPIPFLLGGHSLVSGGMYLAAEIAWLSQDRPVRCRPLILPSKI